jgi:hypothetical protein
MFLFHAYVQVYFFISMIMNKDMDMDVSMNINKNMNMPINTYCKLRKISYIARLFFPTESPLLSADCCCVQSGVTCVQRRNMVNNEMAMDLDMDMDIDIEMNTWTRIRI